VRNFDNPPTVEHSDNLGQAATLLNATAWHNTVAKRVGEILTALHRDIQHRENLLATAFRQLTSRINPEDAELESKRLIRELLEKTRMSIAFGGHSDEIASAVWRFLVERFLVQRQSTFSQVERTKNHSREFFESICVDFTYRQYTAMHAPPESLGADDLLNLVIWLDRRFSARLSTHPVAQADLDRLEAIFAN